MEHACGLHAAHGEVSQGPCYSLTPGSVHWWTDDPALAIESFTFGYQHPWSPEDIGWELTTLDSGEPPLVHVFGHSWDAPVGTGFGPLHGPWPPDSMCWSNEDCEAEYYCWFHDCAAETGACVLRPEICPELWDPVCGCDGETYENACYAAMAGMSIDYYGPCSQQECPWDCEEVPDGQVDIDDLIAVINHWGPCP